MLETIRDARCLSVKCSIKTAEKELREVPGLEKFCFYGPLHTDVEILPWSTGNWDEGRHYRLGAVTVSVCRSPNGWYLHHIAVES